MLVGENDFIAAFSAVSVSKLIRHDKKSEKRWIKKGFIQSRNVRDFFDRNGVI